LIIGFSLQRNLHAYLVGKSRKVCNFPVDMELGGEGGEYASARIHSTFASLNAIFPLFEDAGPFNDLSYENIRPVPVPVLEMYRHVKQILLYSYDICFTVLYSAE
jgi:hypothetical protein